MYAGSIPTSASISNLPKPAQVVKLVDAVHGCTSVAEDRTSESDHKTDWLESTAPCPGGEIGRHKGLKIPRQKCRAGSIPALGTIIYKDNYHAIKLRAHLKL